MLMTTMQTLDEGQALRITNLLPAGTLQGDQLVIYTQPDGRITVAINRRGVCVARCVSDPCER